MNKQFNSANPISPLKSVIETAKYYEQKLGFPIEVFWNNPAYGVVKRGSVFIEFGEGRQEHTGSGVCIVHVEDADVIYEEWKAQYVEFVGDFSDRDYGSKDFRVKVNNGNILIVGHALVNKSELLRKGNVA